MTQVKNKDIRDVSELSKIFKIYDQDLNKDVPLELTTTQKEIFNIITQRLFPRVHCMSYTQYGKSTVVAASVLFRVATHSEKWAIVAPSTEKAQIIMRKIAEFCAKNAMFSSMLEENKQMKGTKLLKELSKKRIVFRNGGEIFILSADNRNKTAAGEALMGFGAPNVVIDESSLIDDDIYSKIKRMLGGSKNNFLFEIGNPFHRNHFLRSHHNDKYHQIVVDWRVGVEEGRIDEKFIEEMRDEFDFGVMYDCKFPEEEDVDADGWSLLLSENDITNSFRENNPNTYGERRLGLDIARSGGNYNVWVVRHENYAEVVAKTVTDNLMDVIGQTKSIAEKYEIPEDNIFIDATGMGAGVYDRFRETNWNVRGINLAQSANNKDKYINIRAEAYVRLQKWIKAGGSLKKNSDWLELTDIRYQTRSNGKIKIIDKETLRKRNIKSPDVADALMLTFAVPEETSSFHFRKRIEENRIKQPSYE